MILFSYRVKFFIHEKEKIYSSCIPVLHIPKISLVLEFLHSLYSGLHAAHVAVDLQCWYTVKPE